MILSLPCVYGYCKSYLCHVSSRVDSLPCCVRRIPINYQCSSRMRPSGTRSREKGHHAIIIACGCESSMVSFVLSPRRSSTLMKVGLSRWWPWELKIFHTLCLSDQVGTLHSVHHHPVKLFLHLNWFFLIVGIDRMLLFCWGCPPWWAPSTSQVGFRFWRGLCNDCFLWLNILNPHFLTTIQRTLHVFVATESYADIGVNVYSDRHRCA